MSKKRKFILKPEHLLLLKNSYTEWSDCEFGAAGIDPKRPYGNGDVEKDIAEILGIALIEDEEGNDIVPEDQIKYINDLHRGTEIALQIILKKANISCGEYETDQYDYCGTDWEISNKSENKPTKTE